MINIIKFKKQINNIKKEEEIIKWQIVQFLNTVICTVEKYKSKMNFSKTISTMIPVNSVYPKMTGAFEKWNLKTVGSDRKAPFPGF